MSDQETTTNHQDYLYDEKINQYIYHHYLESGIIEFYRQTDFDLYKIYHFTIIPKAREIKKLKLDIEKIDEKIETQNETIKTTSSRCKALEARLHPWEKILAKLYYFSDWDKPNSDSKSSQKSGFTSQVKDEQPQSKSNRTNNQTSKENKRNKKGSKKHKIQTNNWLYFANKIWDWFLKAGLGFVIFLSLYEIVTLLEQTGIKINLLASYFLCGLSAVSLVWLSSATVYNAVLANAKQDNIHQYPENDTSSNQNNTSSNQNNTSNIDWGIYRVYFWMIVIGLLEFYIGQGLIFLIDKNLTKQNSSVLSGITGSSNTGLTGEQKFAITCSIAIFAIVNILHAYYRGKKDSKNQKLKHDIAFLLEQTMRLEQEKEELELRRSEKEAKITQLEQEIDLIKMYPHDYIHRRDVGLTNAIKNDDQPKFPEVQTNSKYPNLINSKSGDFSQNGQPQQKQSIPKI